ncbi:hypothetical protein [Winogradskyella forsetii]|uniref:hypothetical protein n=1 Tax=Winogradskyella forsetii TaxID=2686077 RepID=UPI0015BBE503|nr:hypothetical protein [Winogradskyella forsetii]
MANDEILIKVAADLSDLKEGFNNNEELWRKHNAQVASGEKAIKDYVNTVTTENKKVDKALQSNIDKVAAEGKAVQNLEKKFESFNKKNEKSFDTKKIESFNTTLNDVSKNIGNLEQFDISTEDMDYLTGKLSAAQDDFETLNILVDFFESKMKDSATSVADSFDVIKQKIDETKLNISSTQGFIKDIDKQIDNTAPGQDQANLVSERNAATKALNEEKIALADYQAQLKKAREENVSMATQLRKVKDELVQLEIAGERGGARWIELSEKAEVYNDAIASTNAELRRTASSTEGLDNLIGAAAGILGVFSAAEGAAALFGNESEDLQKTLVRLNGAIALLNGLQAIQTELAKKETLAARTLTIVRGQYAIATDSGAKSTVRLAAATKLLGIGLLVGALAAIVVYWKDIAKFIGLTSDETERLNAVQKKSNDIAGEQIAKLKILVDRVEEGKLSFQQKQKAVEDYNEEFGDTLGAVTSYTELEKKLIEQGADYIAYLGLKAKAEAAYQLAVEKSKEALEAQSNTEISLLSRVKSVGSFIAGGGSGLSAEGFQLESNFDASNEAEEQSKKLQEIADKNEKLFLELRDKLGITVKGASKDVIKEYEKLSNVLESLINQQESYRIDAIENSREREKEILRANLNDEKENYQQQIDDLKVSEAKKAKLREEFNKLYNEESGVAYEQLRKDILKIDEKYENDLLAVKLKAQSAIDSVFKSEAEIERKAIQDKFKAIRDEFEEQLKLTQDVAEKEKIEIQITTLNTAEDKKLSNFDLNTDLDTIDRENEIAQTILAIQQANSKDIIQNEELKQLQLLTLQKNYLNEILDTYQDSFKDVDNQTFLNELTNTLVNSVDSDEIQDAADRLREAFGEDLANEILKTVEALKEVQGGIDDIGETSNFEKVVGEIGEWTDSIESFSRKLAETLGLQGKAAEEFAEGVATAIAVTFDSIQSIFQQEIDEHRDKIKSFEESIDEVEEELEREQQLYEDGYANNYEARKADLEDLKARKKEEEEELAKAQKRKATLAKAEFLIDTASQLSNMITAATNIFSWASAIPIIGIPLAIGLVAAMFGAFAVAKVNAYQAIGSGQNYRRGLEEGPLSLSGPRHEERGFGLYNSKTGERVAEFEDGEDVLVVNRSQKKKYRRVIDALIADAQGRASLDSTLAMQYSVEPIGNDTMQVIKHVNEITIKSQKSKEEASVNDIEDSKDLKAIKKLLINEFEGFKDERDDAIEAWETKDYYYVKKGNHTKKYRKE